MNYDMGFWIFIGLSLGCIIGIIMTVFAITYFIKKFRYYNFVPDYLSDIKEELKKLNRNKQNQNELLEKIISSKDKKENYIETKKEIPFKSNQTLDFE